jgi:PPOX class probable F420-dependent enzyme
MFDTPAGKKAAERLRTDRLAWLVTVRADGLPQPSLVWFLWDGESFLLYSRPRTQKLRNIRRRPLVSLHLDSDGVGSGVVVVAGEARIAGDEPPADQVEDYVRKYSRGIERLGMTAPEFARAYSVALRIRPLALRAY